MTPALAVSILRKIVAANCSSLGYSLEGRTAADAVTWGLGYVVDTNAYLTEDEWAYLFAIEDEIKSTDPDEAA